MEKGKQKAEESVAPEVESDTDELPEYVQNELFDEAKRLNECQCERVVYNQMLTDVQTLNHRARPITNPQQSSFQDAYSTSSRLERLGEDFLTGHIGCLKQHLARRRS